MSNKELRREIGATISLSIPLALTQLAGMAISVTDVVMSGWLGPRFLAAETLASTLSFPLHFVAIGLAAAVAPMVAQDLAQDDQRGARRTLRQGLWVLLCLSLPIMAVLWFAEPLLLSFGQDPDLAKLAEGYLRVALWGTAGSLTYLVFRNYLAAYGRTRIAVIVMAIAICTNAIANYILMFGKFGFPRLELVGLGVSTMLTSLSIGAALAIYLMYSKYFRDQKLFQRFWRPDWARFREVINLGLPIAGTMLAETLMIAVLAMLVGLFGPLQLAAHSIAIQCAGISYMFFTGVGQACTVRIASFAGVGNILGARRAGLSAGIVGGILTLIWAAAFIIFGAELAGLFLDETDPETSKVIAMAVVFLLIGAAFQFGDAAQVVALGALRGLKDTRVPLIIALISYWLLGLPAGLFFGFVLEFEGPGIWAGIAVGLSAVAIGGIWRFQKLSNKLRHDLEGNRSA